MKVDAVLKREAEWLEVLYKYGKVDEKMDATPLLGISDWIRLASRFLLLNKQFTAREACLAFTWSRMNMADDLRRAHRATGVMFFIDVSYSFIYSLTER